MLPRRPDATASRSPSSSPPSAPPAPDRARGVGLAGLLAQLHRWAESGWAGTACALWAFLNGFVVPGPADSLLVPLGLADPRRAFYLAWWTIAGAIPGGLAAYGLGALAFDELAVPLLEWLGLASQLSAMEAMFDRRGWMLFVAAMFPGLSTKLVAIAAGGFGYPFPTFVIALSGARVIRFLAVATVLRFAGAGVRRWMERRAATARG